MELLKKNNDIGSYEFNYSVSGSTLTIKELGNDKDLIATINSDGSIDGMKEFKGNLYAFAEAEANEKRLLAKAHIAIVDGTVCTCESRTFKSNANPQEDSKVVNGTVSGNTLTFIFEEDDGTASGKLSDKEIVIDTPDGGLTLKRM